MKKIFCILSATAILFISCQKEYLPDLNENPDPGGGDTSATNAITGTWSFVSATVHTESSVDYDFFGTNEKTVTISDYTTSNNTGTYVITDAAISANNVGYSTAFVSKTFTYENNVPVDSFTYPFNVTIPPTSGTSAYVLSAADSITFTGNSGGFFSTTDSAQAAGSRFVLNGNNLTFYQNAIRDTVIDMAGELTHSIIIANETILLQKP